MMIMMSWMIKRVIGYARRIKNQPAVVDCVCDGSRLKGHTRMDYCLTEHSTARNVSQPASHAHSQLRASPRTHRDGPLRELAEVGRVAPDIRTEIEHGGLCDGGGRVREQDTT